MYKIIFTERAVKDVQKLNPEIRKRIALKIKEFSDAPLDHARKLSHPKIGSYRFRIGDYRVIFDIIGDEIVILRIGHRKEIYK